MPADNLFLALRRYTPGPNMDPLENFLTEAFAWLLRQHEGLADHFLQFVLEQCKRPFPLPEGTPGWLTQEGDGQVWLDMVADFGDKAIIFEHKTWSPLSDDQIQKYRDYASRKWSAAALVVLITARKSQHAQEPDAALTWAQVHRKLKMWLDNQSQPHIMVEQFLDFLRAERLGSPDPAVPLSHESILAYSSTPELEISLKALVNFALYDDWSWFYTKINSTQRIAEPYLRWTKDERYRDGRLGLDLLEGWRPGFFVGVIMDGRDHRVKPSKNDFGPDFCFVLSYYKDAKDSPTLDEFIDGDEYSRLLTRLASEGVGWDVLNRTRSRGGDVSSRG